MLSTAGGVRLGGGLRVRSRPGGTPSGAGRAGRCGSAGRGSSMGVSSWTRGTSTGVERAVALEVAATQVATAPRPSPTPLWMPRRRALVPQPLPAIRPPCSQMLFPQIGRSGNRRIRCPGSPTGSDPASKTESPANEGKLSYRVRVKGLERRRGVRVEIDRALRERVEREGEVKRSVPELLRDLGIGRDGGRSRALATRRLEQEGLIAEPGLTAASSREVVVLRLAEGLPEAEGPLDVEVRAREADRQTEEIKSQAEEWVAHCERLLGESKAKLEAELETEREQRQTLERQREEAQSALALERERKAVLEGELRTVAERVEELERLRAQGSENATRSIDEIKSQAEDWVAERKRAFADAQAKREEQLAASEHAREDAERSVEAERERG